jgi:outer membrane protein OmpA-like peptidoglycan-associated protein
MLSWLAVHAKSDLIESDLEQRSRVALAAAGHDWASVVFSGREGLLVGHLASARQRDDAAALVRDVWGVRTVETRVALSPAGASLPVAPVAAEIAPRGLNDVAPGSIGAAAATELARGAPDIGHAALDQAPAMTVRARDQGGPPSPEAASAAPLPEQKPTVAAGAPSLAVTALPASGQSAPVPERKPALPASLPTVAEAVQRAAGPAAPPPEKKPGEAAPTAPQAEVRAPVTAPAPPLPQRAPRFETAALPQGNIAAEDDCIEQVRQAAKRVEVHFAHGGAKLDMAGKALIDGLIGTLHGCPGTALHVAGHSDASGHPGRNLTLSKHRARAVASYMIHKGIDAGRLVAIGYGDTKPVAPNDTRENRAKNRRIEVAITARAAPLPPLPVRKQGTDNGLSRR